MRRRRFLTLSPATLGGALLYTLDRKPSVVHAQNAGRIRVPLRFLTEQEALDIAAAAARIFPSDASGPGANEAGVVIYIDRQLAGPYGKDRYRYTQPPFDAGIPEQGYQGKATPREIYREGLPHISDIRGLSDADRDELLRGIEGTLFFQLLRTHTIEGMFCDPMHGGNADMIGWQLIGFPGPRMSYANDVDQHYGKPLHLKPVSLERMAGRKIRPSEDENI